MSWNMRTTPALAPAHRLLGTPSTAHHAGGMTAAMS